MAPVRITFSYRFFIWLISRSTIHCVCARARAREIYFYVIQLLA